MWSCIVQLSFIYIVNEYLNVDTGVGRVSIVIFMMQVGTLVFFIVRQFFFKNTCSSKKQIFTQGPLPIKLENLLVKSLDKTAPFFSWPRQYFFKPPVKQKSKRAHWAHYLQKHKIYILANILDKTDPLFKCTRQYFSKPPVKHKSKHTHWAHYLQKT